MKVEYALVSQYNVISLWHNKRRIPYNKIEEIITTNIEQEGIDIEKALEYKRIVTGLLSLNLVLFASEFITEAGGVRRPIKASSVIGNNKYELDLRTMEQTITPLK